MHVCYTQCQNIYRQNISVPQSHVFTFQISRRSSLDPLYVFIIATRQHYVYAFVSLDIGVRLGDRIFLFVINQSSIAQHLPGFQCSDFYIYLRKTNARYAFVVDGFFDFSSNLTFTFKYNVNTKFPSQTSIHTIYIITDSIPPCIVSIFSTQ